VIEPHPDVPRRRILRVSEITHGVRVMLEDRYRDVWVEGEVSNFKPHASGHWYFTLKDEDAQLRAVMFRKENGRLRLELEDGMQVLCRGRLTVYEKRGEYQLIIEELEARGSGALLVAFEQLKSRLEAEGLFRAERKRLLPLLPRRVGIVTSPTGAALHDMLKIIRRRDPRMSVLVRPVRVQGDGAAREVAGALLRLARSGRVDVIIVGRGGGSMEDLWAFNEEVVARAIAASPVPVVSAVGHEVDFTIADFVADLRAPTPSAAAELVVAERARLEAGLAELQSRAARAFRRQIGERRHLLQATVGRLADPRRIVAARRMALDDSIHRAAGFIRRRCSESRRQLAALTVAMRHPTAHIARSQKELARLTGDLQALARRRLAEERRTFEVLCGKLAALSPLGSLGRGYAIARRPGGEVVQDAASVNVGEALEILLASGTIDVRVERARPAAPDHKK
jgi:exodeoxyribonuclease VII large subunit